MSQSDLDCPLCGSDLPRAAYDIPGSAEPVTIDICGACHAGLADPISARDHWQALTDTMWSGELGVNVLAFRLLRVLRSEAWAQDALDLLYLSAADQAWAEAAEIDAATPPTLDANGTALAAGDTVTLIKDLPVKGAGVTAKRGTSVRNISLSDNPAHIEGKVAGQRIVLVAAFLKKST